ncbi:MAG: TIGR02281 family clan AA aspartic protease [Pseudomonadota bacterium]
MDVLTDGNLTFLIILLAAIVGSFVLAQRTNVARLLRSAGTWGLIFLGVLLAASMWDDLSIRSLGRATVSQDGAEIRVPQGFDGHYYLTLEINGAPVRFVVDTGATDIVLTQDDARKAGIDMTSLNFLGSARTANGVVQTAPIRIDSVAIGPIEDRGVRAVVNGGELHESLLGMGYLSRFGTIIIEGGEMTLRR